MTFAFPWRSLPVHGPVVEAGPDAGEEANTSIHTMRRLVNPPSTSEAERYNPLWRILAARIGECSALGVLHVLWYNE